MQRDRRRSRSRSHRRGEQREQEQKLRDFYRHYPADDRAREYLEKSSPGVVERVVRNFRPRHEGQDDYSAQLTTFVKMCRTERFTDRARERSRPRQERGSPASDEDEAPPGSPVEEEGEEEVEEAAEAAEAEEEAFEDDADMADSGLRGLVIEVGRKMGRSPEDVEPFITLLEDNWYDTVESLEEVSAQDLASLGLPLRFGKELLATAPTALQAVETGPHVGGEDHGRGGSGEKGKGKGKAKGKGKFKGEDGKGKGKSKSEGKGKSKGKGKVVPPRSFATSRADPPEHELEFTVPVPLRGLPRQEEHKAIAKIVGKDSSNLNYIRRKSKAEVRLEGSISGHGDPRDPLCVRIRADNQKQLDYAVDLVEDLLRMSMEDGGW